MTIPVRQTVSSCKMNIVKEMSKAQLFVQNIDILFRFQQSRFVAFCATLLNRVWTHEKLQAQGELPAEPERR
jgi:hypothetical protein